MNAKTFTTDAGRGITLGKCLGNGGEGAVYELTHDPAIVAKLYHHPVRPDKAAKLAAMASIRTDRLLKLAAWPTSTLHPHSNGPVVGLLMPRVNDHQPIHHLYSPKSRKTKFPDATWPFIIHAAMNTARAFAVLHEHGHVVGDVNHGNVLVSVRDATVTLIDCDSFQIHQNGHKFLCEVGVPTFTAPELQGCRFDRTTRDANHDNFGLALLIFHLLFMGRHPFAGRYLGPGDMPIEKAIAEFRFAFSNKAQLKQMAPPPNTLALRSVSDELAFYFERAFSPEALKQGRPSANEWFASLDRLRNSLGTCKQNKSHHYLKTLGACPWCEIESQSGIVLFSVRLALLGDAATAVNWNALWAQVTTIRDPGSPPPPSLRSLGIRATASPQAKARLRRRNLLRWSGISAIAATALAIPLLSLVGEVGFATLVIGLAIGVVLLKRSVSDTSPLKQRLNDCNKRYSQLCEQWTRQVTNLSYVGWRATLDRLKVEYEKLPNQRVQKLNELERRRHELQLLNFLSQFAIQDSHIQGIGAGRKAMLASFGIDSADDITDHALQQVPGIGPTFRARLLGWRLSLEGRFKFNPNLGIDPSEIRAIDQQIAVRKHELETQVMKGISELRQCSARVSAARQQLDLSFKQVLNELAQLQADLGYGA
jgi:DNA-binding helix-hairpin-helix protein with protein kinase domain